MRKSPSKKAAAPLSPAPILSADDAQRILKADLANIVAKVKEKKRLTAHERNLLSQYANSTGAEEPIAPTPSHVTTVTALAGILGVTRRAIQKWRKRYADEIPQNRTNGDYDVAAWRELLRRKGLKDGSGEDGENDDPEDMESLKKRDLRAKAEEREFKLSVLKGDYIAKDEVRESINALVAEAIKMIRDKFENELPPVCAGLDAVRIREEASRAIDGVCELLHRGQASAPADDEEDEDDEE